MNFAAPSSEFPAALGLNLEKLRLDDLHDRSNRSRRAQFLLSNANHQELAAEICPTPIRSFENGMESDGERSARLADRSDDVAKKKAPHLGAAGLSRVGEQGTMLSIDRLAVLEKGSVRA